VTVESLRSSAGSDAVRPPVETGPFSSSSSSSFTQPSRFFASPSALHSRSIHAVRPVGMTDSFIHSFIHSFTHALFIRSFGDGSVHFIHRFIRRHIYGGERGRGARDGAGALLTTTSVCTRAVDRYWMK